MLEGWVLLPTGSSTSLAGFIFPQDKGWSPPAGRALSIPLTPQYLGGEYELREMGVIIRNLYLDQASFQEPDTFLKA